MVESRHMRPFSSEISFDQFFVVDYKINPSFLSDDHVLRLIITCMSSYMYVSHIRICSSYSGWKVLTRDHFTFNQVLHQAENSLVHLVEIECWSAPFRSSVGYFKISIGILNNCFSIKHMSTGWSDRCLHSKRQFVQK
jgi:hypothetical protein